MTEAIQTQTQTVEGDPPPPPPLPVGDLTPARANAEVSVYATDPEALRSAHVELSAWCDAKIAELRAEFKEHELILHRAIKGRWGVQGATSMLNLCKRRLTFYEKIKRALELGYIVVPNMPVQLLAVRTRLKTPAGRATRGWADFEQAGQALPEGQGEFRNPEPVVERERLEETRKDGTKQSYTLSYPTDWNELEFPVALANPEIMDVANRALKEKLFDELGFVRDENRPRARKGDPILVGRLRNPVAARLDVTFFLGWRLNTARI